MAAPAVPSERSTIVPDMRSALAARPDAQMDGRRNGTVQSADKIVVRDLNFYYGPKRALENISVTIPANRVTAFIGPSGCGKSTFLRTLNRMNDIIAGSRVDGEVRIDGRDIYDRSTDVVALRRRVGMVFQKSNPFPKSIFENIAYGLRLNGIAGSRSELSGRVEQSLQAAAIWDEVKDRLHESALALSGGQQQRLCIARALAIEPEILLMDEPASALDPIATQRIEELIYQLKANYTIVIVTHNMQQAARVSDNTAFFWLGRLVEFGPTDRIFTNPAEKLTEDVNIAEAVLRYLGHAPVKELIDIPRMADIAQTMLRDALDAYVRRDTALAQAVLDQDDTLDALKTQVFRELLTYMLRDAQTIEPALDLILISRHLERIGDHATNIAEDVIFMVSARDVRHHANDLR